MGHSNLTVSLANELSQYTFSSFSKPTYLHIDKNIEKIQIFLLVILKGVNTKDHTVKTTECVRLCG